MISFYVVGCPVQLYISELIFQKVAEVFRNLDALRWNKFEGEGGGGAASPAMPSNRPGSGLENRCH